MTQTAEALVLDLLEWLARKERSYEETMDAWRTSMPETSGLGGCQRSRIGLCPDRDRSIVGYRNTRRV